MRLKYVTITGADDRTDFSELSRIARDFPSLELGILLSNTTRARPKFPSKERLNELEAVSSPTLRVSAHLCSGYAKAVCRGEYPLAANRKKFGRTQLNIAPRLSDLQDVAVLASCLPDNREYIVQVGRNVELGARITAKLAEYGVHASILFDQSGGRGISPGAWPKPFADIFCGYAGGLGPDNLADELKRIEDVVGATEIWIDMETKVRSDENTLDLGKVRRVLEIASPYSG